jgi:DNA polymerase I-like protein with 3'-5' exonuclease and polymerase domains
VPAQLDWHGFYTSLSHCQTRGHPMFKLRAKASPTGRLPSIPQPQQLNVRTAEGERIRAAFTETPSADEVFKLDYSELEQIVAAAGGVA